MTVQWQLRTFLQQHNITVYAVWKASGVSKTTLYAISNGHMDGVQFETLAKLVSGIERIMGRAIRLEDIIKVKRDDPPEAANRLEQSST